MESPAGWVPEDAWLAPGYAEWPAPPALSGAVACLWARVDPDAGPASGLVLPDGCCDLIWEQGTGAYVAGPDTGPVRTAPRPGTVVAGVRFRPGTGGPAFGMPLNQIRDQRAALADLLPSPSGRTPRALRLEADLEPAAAAQRILDVAGRLVAGGTPDPAIACAAAMLADPAARAEQVATELGLSERQFRRRCHAAVGYGPKTLQRVLRFQRFVRMLDASGGTVDLAESAAAAGYADQAHLTRECGALSGLPPSVLGRTRR